MRINRWPILRGGSFTTGLSVLVVNAVVSPIDHVLCVQISLNLHTSKNNLFPKFNLLVSFDNIKGSGKCGSYLQEKCPGFIAIFRSFQMDVGRAFTLVITLTEPDSAPAKKLNPKVGSLT